MNINQIPHSKPWIIKDDMEAVVSTLSSGMISGGSKVEEFSDQIKAYMGGLDGLLTQSGTEAIALGLLSLGVRAGDEVIIPTYVCTSVLRSIKSIGAIPRICDTDEFGLLVPSTVLPKLTSRVKALIAVHIFGFECKIRELSTLGIPILEDACQAFGFQFRENMAGTLGDVAVFSFHATKCLTTGEGGMVVSKDPSKIHFMRQLLEASSSKMKLSQPMSDLQAALGSSQLSRYASFLNRRYAIKERYVKAISDVSMLSPSLEQNTVSFRFILNLSKRYQAISAHFGEMNICVRTGVDELLHRVEGYDDAAFPNAVNLASCTLSIPYYPALSEEEIRHICIALSEI